MGSCCTKKHKKILKARSQLRSWRWTPAWKLLVTLTEQPFRFLKSKSYVSAVKNPLESVWLPNRSWSTTLGMSSKGLGRDRCRCWWSCQGMGCQGSTCTSHELVRAATLFHYSCCSSAGFQHSSRDSDLHWITYPHTRERKKQKLFKFQSHVRVRAQPTQASPWESGPVPAPLGEPLLGKQQLVNVSGELGRWCGAWLAQGSQGACFSSLPSLPEASEAACQISQRRTRVTMF